MKVIFTFLTFFIFVALNAQTPFFNFEFEGTFNPADKTETLGGQTFWEYRTLSNSSSAQNKFLMDADGGFNRWGNVTTNLNEVFTLQWAPNNPPNWDGTFNSNVVLGNTYIWRTHNNAYNNCASVIMALSASPVTITAVSSTFTGAGMDLPITLTTSGTPPAEQRIMVRYTTNGFATSTIIEATGSGTTYSATIPGSDVGTTPNHQVYFFTTTVAANNINPNSIEPDLVTINLNNNGGLNYQMGVNPLPVELISFQGNLRDQDVQLTWITATEQNNAGFDVERYNSTFDSWEVIGFMKSQNSNSLDRLTYNYLDESAAAGEQVYRLRQIDLDGTFEYSNLVTVLVGKDTKTVRLSPNPAKDIVLLDFAEDTYETISVFDGMGKLIHQQPASLLQITLTDFPKGSYFVQLVGKQGVQTAQLVVQ